MLAGWFTGKTMSTSSVLIRCEKLLAKGAVDAFRAIWKKRLGNLAEMLAEG